MSEQIQPIRGMNDILPVDTVLWQQLESLMRRILASYGYQEIRIPVVERTELFKRSIGEVTDIVEKEMYTFSDRNDVSLTLRPEATAGIVRAGISNGLLHNQRQKLWCAGPMFRYEKPQKGRYRQFHQLDVEALGYEGPDIDAELIIMSRRIWQELGIKDIELQINSLGTPESRAGYRDKLVTYFSEHMDLLDADSKNRLHRNPMRILDTKNPAMKALVDGAPLITDSLDAESSVHFQQLRNLLDDAGIAYQVNPGLVRGLDYYSRTVFEWVTDSLGAQGAVCSGGRYDGLVEHLGGRHTPAVGWALGMERLLELYRLSGAVVPEGHPDVYVIAVGDEPLRAAFRIAETLRDEYHNMKVEINCGGGSFKSQIKRADRSGATVALILGEDEVADKTVGLKLLREQSDQQSVAWDAIGDVVIDAVGMSNK